jgi:hypothetical protein
MADIDYGRFDLWRDSAEAELVEARELVLHHAGYEG